MEKKGVRVITAMNRKGGCGKSTLIRGLASAAQDRGETVTIFDTDGSQGLYKWMTRAKAADAWSADVEVVASLDANKVEGMVEEIFSQPDQEHLILIDTFGGGSDPEAQDLLVDMSDIVVAPCMLSEEDLEETKETWGWYARLRERVSDPDSLPPFHVLVSRVPSVMRAPDNEILEQIFMALPAFDEFVSNRSVYSRMGNGLLGPIRDNLRNKGVAAHVQDALNEMTDVLDLLDRKIAEKS